MKCFELSILYMCQQHCLIWEGHKSINQRVRDGKSTKAPSHVNLTTTTLILSVEHFQMKIDNNKMSLFPALLVSCVLNWTINCYKTETMALNAENKLYCFILFLYYLPYRRWSVCIVNIKYCSRLPIILNHTFSFLKIA